MKKFIEHEDTMVLTTKSIINRKRKIVFISHDYDDGMWEFLDEDDLTEDNACIVSLGEILNIDSSVNDLYDLPLGWIAYKSDNMTWTREKYNG